jgi:hypothetical protein
MQTGFIVITRDEKSLEEKHTNAYRLVPYMWWVPVSIVPPPLSMLQEVVGGPIELVPYRRGQMTMYCNEYGKISEPPLPLSPLVPIDYFPDILHGDLLIIGTADDEGYEKLLTLDEANKIVLYTIPEWRLQC